MEDGQEHVGGTELQLGEDYIVPIEPSVRHTSASKGRMMNMRSLHAALSIIFKPIAEAATSGLSVVTASGTAYKSFPMVVSYCSDIPEGKDVSCFLHNMNVRKPCIRCNVDMDDIKSLRQAAPRSMARRCEVRRNVEELQKEMATCTGRLSRARRSRIVEEITVLLKNDSLSPWKSFL